MKIVVDSFLDPKCNLALLSKEYHNKCCDPVPKGNWGHVTTNQFVCSFIPIFKLHFICDPICVFTFHLWFIPIKGTHSHKFNKQKGLIYLFANF